MAILLGIALALGALYFWMAGNWFGRIVAFLALAPITGTLAAIVGAIAGQIDPVNGGAAWAALIGFIAGAAAAWPLSDLPRAMQRRQAQRLAAAKAI